MPILLKQSTASQEVLLGPFLDDTDGKTAETGLTIANTDIKVWKAGGTTEANKNSGGATHIASGRYYAVLDATDTDTLGPLELNIHVSGALPVRRECLVVTAARYDVITGTTALVTAAAVADAVWDEALTDHVSAGSFGQRLYAPRTGTAAGGAAGTLTLDGSASAVDDFYNGCLVFLSGGTGVGQARLISDYNGTTKVATVHPDWETTPDNTAVFLIVPVNEDSILYRDLATLQEGDAEKKSFYTALAKLVNKVASSAGTTTVYRTDGVTSHATQSETTDAAADPLTGLGGAA